MSIDMIDKINNKKCRCGKVHNFNSEIITGSAALGRLTETLEKLKVNRPFVIADKNTYFAAGKAVCGILSENKKEFSKYVFKSEHLEPDELNVGLAVMNFDPSCDVIIGVGSGVINDISKIVASVSAKPYIIVATAPSMDGYASATSSMTMEGIKITLPSKCADVIIGDTDILCKAPLKMMKSGLGDMIAKYISICEWRISNLINGEYYCQAIADLVKASLKKCTDNADGLLKRDKTAVEAVFEGLCVCGAAMKFAGLSRPASGVEHYISHIWDMRGAEFSEPVEFHGIQCALGTFTAAKLYEKLTEHTPDVQKAKDYVEKFDYNRYCDFLTAFLGKSAEGMIKLEEKEQKYGIESHNLRIHTITDNWDKILQIISEEIPPSKELAELFDKIGLPKTPEEIGLENSVLPPTFKATKDIRDKYVLSRLCWDLGIIDEII